MISFRFLRGPFRFRFLGFCVPCIFGCTGRACWVALEGRAAVALEGRAAVALEGRARGGDGMAVDSDESPAIVLSKADRFIGYPTKDVAQALQKQFPHAKIEIVRDGRKVAGVRNDRILIFADSYDEVARGPTVG